MSDLLNRRRQWHFLHREIYRHELSKRQTVIFGWLVDVSIGWGKLSVKLPKLETLVDLTGFAPSHVNETVRELVSMRMIEVKRLAQATEITTITNSDLWKCKPRQIKPPIDHALEWLRVFNLGSGEEILEALMPVEYDYPVRQPEKPPIAESNNNDGRPQDHGPQDHGPRPAAARLGQVNDLKSS